MRTNIYATLRWDVLSSMTGSLSWNNVLCMRVKKCEAGEFGGLRGFVIIAGCGVLKGTRQFPAQYFPQRMRCIGKYSIRVDVGSAG